MNEIEKFKREVLERIESYGNDPDFKRLALEWTKQSLIRKYVYNFEWLGRPIIQMPQDIIGLQEVIWKVKPDLIIETGIAHGGSIIFSASMLELLGGNGKVVGVDIDIREHNRKEIENHPMFKRIELIEGSSISEDTAQRVRAIAADYSNVMVILDSNHTHNHVSKELEIYSSLVSIDSYLVVFDTFVEDMPRDFFHDRPWNVGDNPKTAVFAFLKENDSFEIDNVIENKLMVSSAPSGFLKRVR
ncbi:MAG: cephalosporin hydroxylase [Acidobacteria bacterium]|nr:MAG: cephalosporin hydroxylase [Acidobacteriota bacterium]